MNKKNSTDVERLIAVAKHQCDDKRVTELLICAAEEIRYLRTQHDVVLKRIHSILNTSDGNLPEGVARFKPRENPKQTQSTKGSGEDSA